MDAGLDLIAICDHNTAGNAAAVQEVAEGPGEGRVTVIAGIEIATREEVHILGLFPNVARAEQAAAAIQSSLHRYLPGERRYGKQLLMNGDGDTVAEEDCVLSAACALDLGQTVALVRGLGGLAVAAHVDRPSFSVTSQLGFFPPDVRFDAIEISASGVREGRADSFVEIGLPIISGSDSHSLNEIGASRAVLEAEAATFDEVASALLGRNGRSVRIA